MNCAICKKPLDQKAIMAVNPKTGKNALMHQACWRREMDRERQKFLDDTK